MDDIFLFKKKRILILAIIMEPMGLWAWDGKQLDILVTNIWAMGHG